ncbi:RES family NAD+ phosphorylase [Limimaricola sp.]|uniref:RES family NAD+ phosphorylase n=1 Tax=Limimaricola sp. TaxID=2211665 RepID=UPI00405967FD
MPRSEDLRPYRRNVWRVIEGQYRSATMRIVDSFEEQETLEALLEASKPEIPEECRHLDFQFFTPFRYGRYPRASRFRRAGRTPGVWYGAEESLTAICETIWGGLRFFAASPGTPLPRKPVEHTAVMAEIRAPLAIDLTDPAFAGQGAWSDPEDYEDCLALADAVRAQGCEVIRYASVRHPERAANVAVLSCRAFAQPQVLRQETWHILLAPERVRVSCKTLGQRYTFAVKETALAMA